MKNVLTQIAIGVVTSVAVAIVLESWREKRARAPLPQPPAPGQDHV